MESIEVWDKIVYIAICKRFKELLERCDSCLVHPYKIEKYWDCSDSQNRLANDFDLNLFEFVNGVKLNKSHLRDNQNKCITVNKWTHPRAHHQNVRKIYPYNLIFSLVFKKFITSSRMYQDMANEIFSEGVYLTNGTKILDYCFILDNVLKFKTHCIKQTILSLYKTYGNRSDDRNSKNRKYIISKIANYIGTTFSYVGFVVNYLDTDQYFHDHSEEDFCLFDHELLAGDGIQRITYRGIDELTRKTIDFLYAEWSRYQRKNYKYDEYCLYFKDMLWKCNPNELESYIYSDFKEYTHSILNSFQITPQKIASPSDVIARLSTMDAYSLEKETLEDSKEDKNREQQIQWVDGIQQIDEMYCLLFLYYHSFFKRLDEDSKEVMREFRCDRNKDVLFNKELFELLFNIEKYEKKFNNSIKYYWVETLSSIIDRFLNITFKEDLSILKFLKYLSNSHPSFAFEIKLVHLCDNEDISNISNARNLEWNDNETPSDLIEENKSSTEPIIISSLSSYNDRGIIFESPSGTSTSLDVSLQRSFLLCSLDNKKDTMTTFDDDLLNYSLSESDLDVHYTCWNSNEFSPSFVKIPNFLFIFLKFTKEWKNLGRIWRFKLFSKLWAGNKTAELLGVIFNSNETYSVFSKIEREDKEEGVIRDSWFNYEPQLISTATKIHDSYFEDGKLVVKETDFEANAHPCLLLYSFL